MAGLVSHGIRVPDEMRIVGIDDVSTQPPAGAADYPTPELRRYRRDGHGNDAATSGET